ncbi:RNA-binding protein with serine-rich domain 1 [Aspergillus undulatus]|uniref:RNA-binding protein with serine-rich domain 1 n=1 Tax=Aspergillus undulatus TaxID=1810928 RepID=UPI003CCD2B74
MHRETSRERQLRRSVSPRSESRSRRDSRSSMSEGSDGGRNGHRPASRSMSRTRSLSRSRGRSRRRSWSRSPPSRSYRARSYSRSESPPGNAQRSSKIVIEKLTKNVTEAHLYEIFEGFGEIQSVDLPMNYAFMTNRGTAYILYNDPADAEAAIAHMHEAQLDGAVLNVSIVLPKRAFSRSPPPVSNTRTKYGRQRHFSGRPADNRSSRHSPYHQRTSPSRRYGRSRPVEGHDLYRPRSLSCSRSRSPRRSRSLSSLSLSASPPRRKARTRGGSPRRGSRRSPSYSSYDYSSRSRSRSRSRSYSGNKDRIQHPVRR